MDTKDFDDLAGRIEGLARAVLILAHSMERETNIDGLSLSDDWRKAVEPAATTALRRTAHKTLQGLADALDRERSRHQESQLRAMLADPKLMQAQSDSRGPVSHRHLDALGTRMTHAESRLDHLVGKAPPRQQLPKASA